MYTATIHHQWRASYTCDWAWASPEGTSSIKKGPQCPWRSLFLSCLLSRIMHILSHRMYSMICQQSRSKTQSKQMSLHVAQVPPQNRQQQHCCPFSRILQDSSGKKSSQWAEHQGVHWTLHSAWKEKWLDVWLFIDSWVIANDLAGYPGIWKECCGKLGTKTLGKTVCRYPSPYRQEIWRGLCAMYMFNS